jgi:hexosaminidase
VLNGRGAQAPRHWRAAVLSLALYSAVAAGAGAPALIPVPRDARLTGSAFALTAATPILVPERDASARRSAEYLAGLLTHLGLPALALRTERAGEPRPAPAIVFRRRPGTGLEDYAVAVDGGEALLLAHGDAGLLHAAVTLFQLAVTDGSGGASIPGIRIEDAPRYPWRGLMLDSARHYQSPEFIESLIDWMALHKLNVLHWHLTDDQGWRLEIHAYPRLTEVGAWRVEAGDAPAHDLDPETGEPRRYGGYYDHPTVRRIVRYARERHVEIVPEIDLPGHASAALAAYPELGVPPVTVAAVPNSWGVYPHVFNIDEATFRFLEQVLDEVTELFPGRYVHVGGDEVQLEEWQASARVATRLKALHLKSVADIHGYFMRRLERALVRRGRRLIGWDEILTPGLSRSATVMSWRGSAGAIEAATRGNDTVLSPDPGLYLDHRQSDAPWEGPGRVTVLSLADVYGFDPAPPALGAQASRHVLGLQANAWTEHMRTEARVAHMMFPRAAALAEVGWSAPEPRDFRDFLARLAGLWPKYAALGLPAADSVFAPRIEGRYLEGGRTVEVTLANQGRYGQLRYTVDGSEPAAASPLASEPLLLALPVRVRAATFQDRDRLSKSYARDFSAALAGRRASAELKLCGNAIALTLEDDAPIAGPRAQFTLDLMHPCWIYPQASLAGITRISAAVGQIPFNFEIGAERAKLRFPPPVTAAGELQILLDSCEGELWLRLPLAPAAVSDATTVLEAEAPARGGTHDLCLRFAQPSLEPFWALDWVDLERPAP